MSNQSLRGNLLRILLVFCTVSLCVGCDESRYFDGQIDWLHDGSRILLGSWDADRAGIYTIQSDGTGLQRLTTATPRRDSPALSPDGRSIAYVVRDVDSPAGQIHLMDVDGKNQHQVEQNKFSDSSPAFSPDGRKLVFARATRYRPYSMGGMVWDDYEVWEMNVDGSEQKRLTHASYYGMHPPSYSPDGTRIMFSATDRSTKTLLDRIFMMERRPDGTVSDPPVIEIAQPPSIKYVADVHPRFSPDGRRIVFVSTRVSGKGWYDYEVWTADPDGSHPQQVTRNQSYNQYPVFSPDGQWIAFLSDPDRKNKSDLWKIRPDGTVLTRLTVEGHGIK